MDTLGSRLKEAMTMREVTVDDLAARKVLSRAGVYQWLNDTVKREKVREETVQKLCDALRVSRSWLMDGRGSMSPRSVQDSALDYRGYQDDHVSIDAYSQAVGLSDGAEAQEYAETHKLKFKADSLTRKRLSPASLAVFYGKGDSMEPRIHSGDAVLFDQSDTRPRDGALFVILVPGVGADSYSVKRCEMIDDLVLFKADNPKGDHGWRKPRRADDPKFPITIIGRVRWIGSWED